MPQGKKLTPEIQWAVVRLSRMLNNDQIAMGLDVSPRSVRRVISYFYVHGTIPSDEEKPETHTQGNRRLVDEDNRDVQKAFDLYLDELEEREESSGVESAGLTMKKTTRVAAERSVEKRLEYKAARIGQYEVDESSVDRRTMATVTPPMMPFVLPPYGYPYSYYPMPVYMHTPSGQWFDPRQHSQTQSPTSPRVPLSDQNTPDVVKWFSYLDTHKERNKIGTTFAPFGPILEGHGFTLISELISEFFPAEDLAKLLSIRLRVATLILGYVQNDLDAISSGRLVFFK